MFDETEELSAAEEFALNRQIMLYDERGYEIGHADNYKVYDTGRVVGSIYARGGGFDIARRRSKSTSQTVAVVTADGNIYFHENIRDSLFTENGNVRAGEEKNAEAMRVGRVEIANGVGTVYDLNGAKVGEVRNAKNRTLGLCAALLTLIVKNKDRSSKPPREPGKYIVETINAEIVTATPVGGRGILADKHGKPSLLKKVIRFLTK